jgi:hypothetical protein
MLLLSIFKKSITLFVNFTKQIVNQSDNKMYFKNILPILLLR